MPTTTIKRSLREHEPIELQQILERAIDWDGGFMGGFTIVNLKVLEIDDDSMVFRYRDILIHTDDWSEAQRMTRQTLIEQEHLIAAHGTFSEIYGQNIIDGIDWRFGTWYADRQAAITNLLNALAN